MADLAALVGQPLARDLAGIARVVQAGTLVVAAEIAACREAAVAARAGRSWRDYLDTGIAALGEALAALDPAGPAAFWGAAESVATTMTVESAARAGGTA